MPDNQLQSFCHFLQHVILETFRNISKTRRARVAYLDFVEQCEDALRQLDAENEANWGISSAMRTLNRDSGRVTFRSPTGTEFVTRTHIVGSLTAEFGLWRWAWDMPAMDPVFTELAETVKAYGLEHQMDRLSTPSFAATLLEAWGFTAVACHLGMGRGAYMERVAGGFLFFVFDPREALSATRRAIAVQSL